MGSAHTHAFTRTYHSTYESQQTIYRSLFPPSTMWVMVTELCSSGLLATALIYQAILPVFKCQSAACLGVCVLVHVCSLVLRWFEEDFDASEVELQAFVAGAGTLL